MIGKCSTFTVNNTTYAYEVSGVGAPLVFLHGFTGTKRTWKQAEVELSKHFQVITIDLPGHGKTKTNQSLSIEDFCSDLASLLTHLNLNQVHLIGYSMGGRVALTFAILHSERVSSLTLESASPGLSKKTERIARMKQDEKLARKIETEGMTAFVDFWENIPLFASQKSLPNHRQQIIRQERLSQTEAGLAMSLRYMGTGRQRSLWDELEKIIMPVLLIVGKLDRKFVEINKQMNEQINESKLIIVEQVGHTVHIEQQQIFNKYLQQFLLGGYK